MVPIQPENISIFIEKFSLFFLNRRPRYNSIFFANSLYHQAHSKVSLSRVGNPDEGQREVAVLFLFMHGFLNFGHFYILWHIRGGLLIKGNHLEAYPGLVISSRRHIIPNLILRCCGDGKESLIILTSYCHHVSASQSPISESQTGHSTTVSLQFPETAV